MHQRRDGDGADDRHPDRRRPSALVEAGIDLKQLSRDGVELFFTQVFRDGFFHADMHPGNIFVAVDPANFGKYIALDFGIVGTLSETDQGYLAQNFLAFFRRDYHRVATAHIESGWVPPDTRVDELETEIRVVCEPIFDRPLKEISLGRVLLQLFRASRRFNVEIQPQLVLLQKTLLNIEGLGRQLDPDLDLWVTAKPFLERWMENQIGLPALQRRLLAEAPYIVAALPELPRLLHQQAAGAALGVRRGDQGARRRAAEPQPAAGADRGAAGHRHRPPACTAGLTAATGATAPNGRARCRYRARAGAPAPTGGIVDAGALRASDRRAPTPTRGARRRKVLASPMTKRNRSSSTASSMASARNSSATASNRSTLRSVTSTTCRR